MTALPVVVPFITAAVLVILRPLSRRWVNDAVSIAGVTTVIVLCAILLERFGRDDLEKI